MPDKVGMVLAVNLLVTHSEAQTGCPAHLPYTKKTVKLIGDGFRKQQAEYDHVFSCFALPEAAHETSSNSPDR